MSLFRSKYAIDMACASFATMFWESEMDISGYKYPEMVFSILHINYIYVIYLFFFSVVFTHHLKRLNLHSGKSLLTISKINWLR